ITVIGVTDGQLSRTALTITFSATDLHLGTTSATLDGAPFVSGSTVGAEGDHTLVVTSTDAAGNTSTRTVHFTIDTTAPVITVSGVADGQLSRVPLTISFSA